jgi:rhodanese-related sulfurtransferase
MPSTTEITVSQLSRLIGLPQTPIIIDVRTQEEFAADPRLIPGTQRSTWKYPHARQRGSKIGPSSFVCQNGLQSSQGVSAWMRHQGVVAQTLEGGFAAWRAEGHLLSPADKVPARDAQGRTVWVTRARPKIVRIACPWLIRRFIDREAIFLFVAPSEVMAVAKQFQATSFDVRGGFWDDRGDQCTFDVMIEEFALGSDAFARLAVIVRGADTGRLELTPQSPGLLAASLGYSRMDRDDLAQFEATMPLYDAFYRWCRDAVNETHA